MRTIVIFALSALVSLPLAAQQQSPAPASQQSGASSSSSQAKKDQQKKSAAQANPFPEAKSKAAQQPDAPTPTPAQKKISSAEANPFPEAESESAAQQVRQAEQKQQQQQQQAPPPSPESSSSRIPGLGLQEQQPSLSPAGPQTLELNSKLGKKDTSVGIFYLQSGDYQGAYDRFKEAVQVDPGNPEAVYGLAQSARHLGKRDVALRYFTLYLEAIPYGHHAKQVRKALKQMGVEPGR